MTLPPIFPNLKRIKHLWDVRNKLFQSMKASHLTELTANVLVLDTAAHKSQKSCEDRSEVFWSHMGGRHNIS